MNYTQCKLAKGNWYRYVWIPEKFAKKGKVLCINDEEGWVVKETYDSETEERVKARERGYKNWRSVTDV